MNDIAYYGQKGLEVFKAKNEKFSKLMTMANIYPNVGQKFARKEIA